MGSLEQHYLARLQAGTTRGTGHPSFAGARGSSMLGLGLPSSQQQQHQPRLQQHSQQQQHPQQQQREHQSARTSSWFDTLAEHVSHGDPRQFGALERGMQGYSGPQAPMSLEDLSAIMQAEQAQDPPPLPALPAQPPLTLANSYLSRLKAHAPSNQPDATAPGPLTGHSRHTAALYEQALFGQGGFFSENMQMPSMPTRSLHSMRDPISSAFDSRAGSDTDARSETAEDHRRF